MQTHTLSQVKIMVLQNKLYTLCNIVKYIITLILLVVSIFLSKDTLDQYTSKAKGFKQYEREVSEEESVTIVIGLWPLKNMNYAGSVPYQSYEQWELGKDFTISFGVTNYRKTQEMINLEDNKTLHISHSSIGKVEINKLVSRWGNYYKISANTVNVQAPFRAFVQVYIKDTVAENNVPSVTIVLASEENSYGITMGDWLDGERINFEKVKGFIWTDIQPKRVIYMKSQEKCTNIGFYECFHSELIEQSFDHCPTKCFSITTFGNATPICETELEIKCSHEVTKALKKDSKCLPFCDQINFDVEFEYKEDQNEPNANRNVTFAFKISNSKMKVEEEYLVQDFVGMLGSIGGTLGLFVGFSFLGGISSILHYLKNLFVFKDLIKENEELNRNVTEVAPKNNSDEMRPLDHEILDEIYQIKLRILSLENMN